MLTIDDKYAVATVKVGPRTSSLLAMIEGRKKLLSSTKLRFEPTGHNIECYKELFPEADIVDNRRGGACDPDAAFFDEAGERPVLMKTQPFAQHQAEAYDRCAAAVVFALFMEQGTGKTWVALKKALRHYYRNEIEGVLVATFKGVHEQWIFEQIPKHLPEDVPLSAWPWHKGEYKRWGAPSSLGDKTSLTFFTINIDALSTKNGKKAVRDYIKQHNGKILFVIDESHLIRNNSSQRTKECYDLGGMCNFRMILTGTPQGKNLIDQWSQYKFLDESIIGERYKTTFRNKYCIMAKDSNDRPFIVGSKNIERFRKKVAPYTYRITKEEALDLPEKLYDRWFFDLSKKTREHYEDLKSDYITMLDDGEVAKVQNAAVLVTRLHQLARGWLVTEDDEYHVGEESIEALKDCIASRHDDKIVIWARFRNDIEAIMDTFGKEAVAYYGGMSDKELSRAKARFLNTASAGARFFVSNPAVGGTGMDGLQDVCSTVVYYSNSYDAILRWQSEDRTHRLGTKNSVNYIDLVARKTVDMKLLSNLRAKRSLSDLALGDIRGIIESGSDEE